ncbi:hypothetical protein QBC47DRAFT_413752 [Echria macrotheca]|uniref:Uncharacterized protein n=1 Tax=Echria macrotheca TaxID=438768 RepID=A0AAJ0BB93_9PEZI|nr:hypothetical protein QBC47DRAFT_413752 [Echria macrotheca]
MAPLVITINNKSQGTASYGVYAEPPAISPRVAATTRIIACAHGVPSGQGQATIILSKNLIATCGIYNISSDVTDPPDPKRKTVGTGVEIIDQRHVDVTYKETDGKIVSGTCLEVDSSSGTPTFVRPAYPAPAVVGAFSVKMRTDFTPQQAASQRFFVGYSCSVRQDIGTYATFVPSPGQTYQIIPSNKFYVTLGTFSVRDVVKLPDHLPAPDTVVVDFDELATDQVTLVHDSYGKLNLQATPALPRNALLVSAPLTAASFRVSAMVEDEFDDMTSVTSGRDTPQDSQSTFSQS